MSAKVTSKRPRSLPYHSQKRKMTLCMICRTNGSMIKRSLQSQRQKRHPMTFRSSKRSLMSVLRNFISRIYYKNKRKPLKRAKMSNLAHCTNCTQFLNFSRIHWLLWNLESSRRKFNQIFVQTMPQKMNLHLDKNEKFENDFWRMLYFLI